MPDSGFFGRLFGNGPEHGAGQRPTFEREPAAIYAIGDVHGRLDLLQKLEAMIAADAVGRSGELWLLLLGDIIDRGPSSAQVVEHVLSPLPGFVRHCLRGNHEDMLLDFLAPSGGNDLWLANGGIETLRSYAVPDTVLFERPDAYRLREIAETRIPAEHIAFFESLPVAIETPGFAFVHAGIRPGVSLAQQSEHDLLWFRDQYASDYAEFSKTIVHGHTPRQAALVLPRRIALDTGAVFTGRLSAARLVPGEAPVLLVAS